MDSTIGWYQREQEGPALELWERVWEAAQEVDENFNASLNTKGRADIINNKNMDYIPLDNSDKENTSENQRKRTANKFQNSSINTYYNKTKRKRDATNRASTYGYKNNCSKYGGQPWRSSDESYGPGIIGYVLFER